jgi:DNA invertase Pin-like site-specific DNA recombinase
VHPCYRQLQINQQKTMTTKDKEFIGLSFRSYNRKSSEQDERQALSIDSQIEQNQKTAENYGIKLTKDSIIKESKSAKKSSTRPEFMILIKEIRRGTVQGIIVWHPDRLSRNAGDAGTLIDLMDEEKLKVIITKQQVFRNTPSDKFFFSMLCSQAKMENDSKGENVKRGLVKKRKMGYPTGLAKIGYENDDEAIKFVEKINGGNQSVPTIVITAENGEEKVFVEPKYNGTRVLIHFKRKGKEWTVRTFTRNLEESSGMFPELKKAAESLHADEVILDSEAVGYDPETDKSGRRSCQMSSRCLNSRS